MGVFQVGSGPRLAACLIALAVCSARSRAEEPAPPVDDLVRLEIPERIGGGEGPLDWVLSRVGSGTDEWRLEEVSEAAKKRLAPLERYLAGDRSAEAGVRALLHPDFRGRDPLPRTERGLVASGARRAWRGTFDADGAALEEDAWIDALAGLRGEIASGASGHVKVYRIAVGADGRVETAVRLDADGLSSSGAHVQWIASWRLAWDEGGAPGDWRVVRMEPLAFERAVLARRDFVDVTRRAFGDCASWREQLAVGVDAWWGRVDQAAGLDIYGHQGIAVGDVDGDLHDDVFVAQPGGFPNRLYRGRGDGTFEDVTRRAGVDILDATGGPLLVDLDGDADLDLVAPTPLEVLIFANDGSGRFELVRSTGLRAGAESRRTTTLGASAADFDLDGDLDLYVYSYVFWAGAGSKLQPTYPWPYHDARNGAPNILYRNDGDLEFTDVTRESGLDAGNRRFTFAASWSDYDDDGDPDLYVANDFGRNNLYRNDGEGHFADVAAAAGVEDTANGMGVTWGDLDGDGLIDLYVSDMWSSAGNRIALQPRFGDASLRATYLRMARGNSVFRNLGDGTFEDVTVESGAAFGRWSWGAALLDIECDGDEDLVVTNGFITGERLDDL